MKLNTAKRYLTTLIKAGVDLHHRNHDGQTPSYYADRNGLWEDWCRALKSSGLDIEDVVRMDGEEWLLSEENEGRRVRVRERGG